jgi:predicted NUDIX family NTP pyrophosphohydrolase
VWICEADIDADAVRSNEVRMEWPKGSGRVITFPEIDRCAWFGAAEARRRINPAQAEMLERLESLRR